MLNDLYRPPLALLTDLYQLTMAYGYWKLARAEQEAVFHLYFRKPPFSGGYAIAAGLGTALEYLQAFRFDESDLEFLATLTGNNGQSLFAPGFLR
jgi:nicotinate phosphoribosyltransferase